MKFVVFLSLAGLAFMGGCTKKGRYLPVTPGAFSVAIPAQQETIAGSVQGAFKKLTLDELKGKAAYVDVAGVLSSSADYYKYVRATAEAQLASQGIKIVPMTMVIGTDGTVTYGAPATVDYRVLVNLDEAGADSITKDYWSLIDWFMKDEFFYQGRLKATVTAYSLKGEGPAVTKTIEGEGKKIEIVGNYTKDE